jgi:2-polyprenyl-3-methyl-5-hydroxy-6-metoxy-1,4-benzoquinol methylase
MDSKSMDSYGQALLDFQRGNLSAAITVRRDDGYESPLPAAVFFRQPSEFSGIERAALALCKGKVLDIGAGTGIHTLALQARGLRVTAIDISPQAVEIMSQRGVQDARRVDLFEYTETRFDTLLMMLHGIGMVETLPGLERFLRHAKKLAAPGGQLIFDSLDVRHTDDPRHLAYQEANRKAGRYFGEIRMRFDYGDLRGPLFGWLHVDPETLADRAAQAGWDTQILHPQEDGNYLARLTIKS